MICEISKECTHEKIIYTRIDDERVKKCHYNENGQKIKEKEINVRNVLQNGKKHRNTEDFFDDMVLNHGYQAFTIPAIITELPEGYKWEEYEDGSGSIVGPDNKRYFSYDKVPYSYAGWIEYRRTEEKEWDIFYDSFSEYKEWVNTIFKNFIQKNK